MHNLFHPCPTNVHFTPSLSDNSQVLIRVAPKSTLNCQAFSPEVSQETVVIHRQCIAITAALVVFIIESYLTWETFGVALLVTPTQRLHNHDRRQRDPLE